MDDQHSPDYDGQPEQDTDQLPIDVFIRPCGIGLEVLQPFLRLGSHQRGGVGAVLVVQASGGDSYALICRVAWDGDGPVVILQISSRRSFSKNYNKNKTTTPRIITRDV